MRLAGVSVGHVGEIRLPEAGSAKVRVELLIARRVQDRIRADSLARIETLGLLGDKIIDVTLGSPGAAVLQDGGELRTEEPFDTARLTQQGAELLRNLVELSTELRDGPRRHHGEPGRGRRRRDRAGAPEPGDRDRAGAGGPSPARLRPEARDGARGRGRDAPAARGDRAPDRSRARPIRGRPVWPARRSGPWPRPAAAAERVNRILREVEEGKGTLHALIYDEGRVLKDLEGVLGAGRHAHCRRRAGRGRARRAAAAIRTPLARVRRVVTAADGLAQAVDRARTEDSVLRALLDGPGAGGGPPGHRAELP